MVPALAQASGRGARPRARALAVRRRHPTPRAPHRAASAAAGVHAPQPHRQLPTVDPTLIRDGPVRRSRSRGIGECPRFAAGAPPVALRGRAAWRRPRSVGAGPRGRESVRIELGVASDDVVVGTIANLRSQKDYPTLLHATARVLERSPRPRFVLIGQGPLEAGSASSSSSSASVRG